MTLTLTVAQLGILAVVTIVGAKLLDLVTGYFFKKLTREDFVTKSDCDNRHKNAGEYIKKNECESCSRLGDAAIEKLTDEIRTIKGILLSLASKGGVPIEELKELVQ